MWREGKIELKFKSVTFSDNKYQRLMDSGK